MLPITKYLFEKIANQYKQPQENSWNMGNAGGGVDPSGPNKDYTLTDHQRDHMTAARARIDEMRRYHQGHINYDKNKFKNSDEWATYVRGLTKDPWYEKVNATGADLNKLTVDMANQDLAATRAKFAAFDKNHPQLNNMKDIYSGVNYNNWEWQNDDAYRKTKGIVTDGELYGKTPQEQARIQAEAKAARAASARKFHQPYKQYSPYAKSRQGTISTSGTDKNGQFVETKATYKDDGTGQMTSEIIETSNNVPYRPPMPVNGVTRADQWETVNQINKGYTLTTPEDIRDERLKEQAKYKNEVENDIYNTMDSMITNLNAPTRMLHRKPGVKDPELWYRWYTGNPKKRSQGYVDLRPGTVGWEAAHRANRGMLNYMQLMKDPAFKKQVPNFAYDPKAFLAWFKNNNYQMPTSQAEYELSRKHAQDKQAWLTKNNLNQR